MSRHFGMASWWAVASIALGTVTMTMGCGGNPQLGGPEGTGGGGGGGGSTVSDGAVPDGGGIVVNDSSARPDVTKPPPDANCGTKVTCSSEAGLYCGQIGD